MLLRGQNSFIYQAVNDWNILSNEAKNISDILSFKRCIRRIFFFLFFYFLILKLLFFKVLTFLSSNICMHCYICNFI